MEEAQGNSTFSPPARNHKIIAEIDPPKGTNLDPFISSAILLRGRIDSIRVTDSENAIMRMAPLSPCLSLKDNNISPTMVINGRDRNSILRIWSSRKNWKDAVGRFSGFGGAATM